MNWLYNYMKPCILLLFYWCVINCMIIITYTIKCNFYKESLCGKWNRHGEYINIVPCDHCWLNTIKSEYNNCWCDWIPLSLSQTYLLPRNCQNEFIEFFKTYKSSQMIHCCGLHCNVCTLNVFNNVMMSSLFGSASSIAVIPIYQIYTTVFITIWEHWQE